jgi:uncharacterized delta-60 repeat protein
MHRITISQRVSLFVLAILLCVSTQAAAKAGDLDPKFGTKGIFSTTTSRATANAVAIQSDGKIVIAGINVANNNFADLLIRLNTDGTLDTSFGSGGIDNLVPPGNQSAEGFFALAIQSDGKIVVGAATGEQGSSVAVARVNTDGSLDTSFGSGGFTTTRSAGSIFFGGGLALQADGKILVAAGFGNPSIMARFTSDGQLDTYFGTGGVVNLQNPGPTQMAVQSDGKILVASGEAGRLVLQPQPPADQAGTIARYNSNGTPDKTFGASGVAASVASASALLLQSDGKIVVAGAITSKLNAPQTASDIGFGLVRYNSDGSIDTKFGTGGVAITDFGANAPDSGAFAVAIQSNGDLVAAGAAAVETSGSLSSSSFGLSRYTSTGKLDTTFGSHGRVITTVASGQVSWVSALAIQSDGKIVAAGTSHFNFEFTNAYVARYLAQ